jgi:hypothetical protein
VSATLPPYVKWLDQVYPSTENVTYDPNTSTVTWNVGSVNAYTDNSKRRELDFQVELIPSITQVSTAPTIVNQATLTATDDFTQSTLTSQQDYLTSSFSTDPAYKSGDETVVQ